MNNLRNQSLAISQSTTSTLKGKKIGRFQRFYESLWTKLTTLYRLSRRSLWIASTGSPFLITALILIFLPLAFGYMSEVEE
jgi:hypothetical protein